MLLVFLDGEKAFDNIGRSYLDCVLQKCENSQMWIMVSYINARTRIYLNGVFPQTLSCTDAQERIAQSQKHFVLFIETMTITMKKQTLNYYS